MEETEFEAQDPYVRALQFLLACCLNEVQRRLVVALLALQGGKEGLARLRTWTGMAQQTVRRGMRELLDQNPAVHWGKRLRRPGGGRKRVDQDPKVNQRVDELLKDETAGDPMNGLKWTRKSLRKLAQTLTDEGSHLSSTTVRKILKAKGYSLKGTTKRKAFQADHPLRSAQFEYIKQLKADCLQQGIPIISVDAKKVEYLGQFDQPGQTWRQTPHETWDHDFLDRALGKLVPYGIYDLARDLGYIYAGTNASTSALAVDAIVWWWKHDGRHQYPQAKRLVILTDNGGADSCRSQLWKWDLQEQLADGFGLTLDVCHYPPGTSKWNPIEHRLCSFISLNWAGRPLTSYEMALNYIRTTTTQTGLQVEAFLSEKPYPTGRKVPPQLLDTIQLTHPNQAPNPDWTYRISPRDATTLAWRNHLQADLQAAAELKRQDRPSSPPRTSSRSADPSPPTKPPRPISYSSSQAATQLGVCTKTLYRWEQDGKITCERTAGNHRRITEAELRRIKRLMASGEW